jgi:ABC-type sugar transport system permease subunit
MIVLYVLPYVMLYFSYTIFPIVFVFCLSLPAFLSAKLYNKFFLKMEEQILAQEGTPEGEESGEDEDERIFRDELDETVQVSQNN